MAKYRLTERRWRVGDPQPDLAGFHKYDLEEREIEVECNSPHTAAKHRDRYITGTWQYWGTLVALSRIDKKSRVDERYSDPKVTLCEEDRDMLLILRKNILKKLGFAGETNIFRSAGGMARNLRDYHDIVIWRGSQDEWNQMKDWIDKTFSVLSENERELIQYGFGGVGEFSYYLLVVAAVIRQHVAEGLLHLQNPAPEEKKDDGSN